MRYIAKGEEPSFMLEWKQERIDAGQRLAYDEFDHKRELNEILLAEQHYICCYCQQKLDHYQGHGIGGSHNEHLIPENGVHGNFDMQMDYSNLYACCIDSRGLKKKEYSKRHCGESKGDKLIRGFIQEKECSSFFRYNILGEIIPNGDYDCWSDYVANRESLTGDVKEAMEAIEILNLNCHFLKADRKGDLDKLMRIISKMSREEVLDKMKEFEQSDKYQRYQSMLLYFMAKKK